MLCGIKQQSLSHYSTCRYNMSPNTGLTTLQYTKRAYCTRRGKENHEFKESTNKILKVSHRKMTIVCMYRFKLIKTYYRKFIV
jgi:hypothetical protein